MKKYPSAIGPYSAYRLAGNMLFVSGQLPIDPESGEILSFDVKDQTYQALSNLCAILEENHLSMKDVLKTTVFLSDINDFVQVNEVYASFFSPPYPARSAFAVKDLPKGAKVEIEAIVYKE